MTYTRHQDRPEIHARCPQMDTLMSDGLWMGTHNAPCGCRIRVLGNGRREIIQWCVPTAEERGPMPRALSFDEDSPVPVVTQVLPETQKPMASSTFTPRVHGTHVPTNVVDFELDPQDGMLLLRDRTNNLVIMRIQPNTNSGRLELYLCTGVESCGAYECEERDYYRVIKTIAV